VGKFRDVDANGDDVLDGDEPDQPTIADSDGVRDS
jgi:hypothetical protein